MVKLSAGIAVGVDGIFIETHFIPTNAKLMEQVILLTVRSANDKLVAIRQTINKF
jgi:2-dehydro-3-deoxyphosphooctonate aldolase (KDO 8-P synthase)